MAGDLEEKQETRCSFQGVAGGDNLASNPLSSLNLNLILAWTSSVLLTIEERENSCCMRKEESNVNTARGLILQVKSHI